jgi:hypothetical protein
LFFLSQHNAFIFCIATVWRNIFYNNAHIRDIREIWVFHAVHELELLVTPNVVPRSPILVSLMMEALRSSKKFGSYKNHTASHPRRRHSTYVIQILRGTPQGTPVTGHGSTVSEGSGDGVHVDRSAKPVHVAPLRALGIATIRRYVASTLRHTGPRDTFLTHFAHFDEMSFRHGNSTLEVGERTELWFASVWYSNEVQVELYYILERNKQGET